MRTVRTQPHLYSAICKARLLYSRRSGGDARSLRANPDLFTMNEFEERQVESLRGHGYALLAIFPRRPDWPDFRRPLCCFAIFKLIAARLLRPDGQAESLEGLSYEELAATEKMIALRDPLIHIPELLGAAFNESILKIAANFLGYVPPLYRATVVRDFPHNRPLHSSNFHKDNDESDSLQIFIYLVDIDDNCGPLIYIPGSNHYDVRSCRPRLSRDLGIASNDGRLSDEEVERIYPRSTWATLCTRRGSVAVIHGNGIHKGPAWKRLGDPNNRPRTAIKLDLHGSKRESRAN